MSALPRNAVLLSKKRQFLDLCQRKSHFWFFGAFTYSGLWVGKLPIYVRESGYSSTLKVGSLCEAIMC